MVNEMRAAWEIYEQGKSPTLEQIAQLEAALQEKRKVARLTKEEQAVLMVLSNLDVKDKQRDAALWQVFQYGV